MELLGENEDVDYARSTTYYWAMWLLESSLTDVCAFEANMSKS
jgi:hypothetical protein